MVKDVEHDKNCCAAAGGHLYGWPARPTDTQTCKSTKYCVQTTDEPLDLN